VSLANQVQKYQLVQIESSTPEGLVVLAYDALLKFLYAGKANIAEKNIEESHVALKKAQLLIWELINALKTDAWEGATDLLRLYQYLLSEIATANVQKNADPLERVIPMVRQLRDAWSNAYKQVQAQKKPSISVNTRG